MKKIAYLYLVLFFTFSACRKSERIIIQTTNLWVANTATNINAIKINPGRNITYANESPVGFGNNRMYLLERTSLPFRIVNAIDSTAILFDSTINFKSGIYTIFVSGQFPNVETVVIEEGNFPFAPTDKIYTSSDSVVNVRFVNLSPNSVPLKVKIANSNNNEVDRLEYKGMSEWKKYNARATTISYSFQIREAVSDALITTYSFTANSTNRFKNVSVVIRGHQGVTSGANAFGISVINYF